MKSINEIVFEIMSIPDSLEHSVYVEMSDAITEALEDQEEELRTKHAMLAYECKNHNDKDGCNGFIEAKECHEMILNSRDSSAENEDSEMILSEVVNSRA